MFKTGYLPHPTVPLPPLKTQSSYLEGTLASLLINVSLLICKPILYLDKHYLCIYFNLVYGSVVHSYNLTPKVLKNKISEIELYCPAELSAMVVTLLTCAVQYRGHWPQVVTEHLEYGWCS